MQLLVGGAFGMCVSKFKQRKNMKKIIFTMVTAAVINVSAHDFYVNLITPNESKPWSVTASIDRGRYHTF